MRCVWFCCACRYIIYDRDIVWEDVRRGRKPLLPLVLERTLLIHARLLAQAACPPDDATITKMLEEHLKTHFPTTHWLTWTKAMRHSLQRKGRWLARAKRRFNDVRVQYSAHGVCLCRIAPMIHNPVPWPGAVDCLVRAQYLTDHGQHRFLTGRSRSEKLVDRRAKVSNQATFAEFFNLVGGDLTSLYGSPEATPPAALFVVDEVRVFGKQDEKNSHRAVTTFAGVPNMMRSATKINSTHITALFGAQGNGKPLKSVEIQINRKNPTALVWRYDGSSGAGAGSGPEFRTFLDGCPKSWRVACTQSGSMSKAIFRRFLRTVYDEIRETVPPHVCIYGLFDNASQHDLAQC